MAEAWPEVECSKCELHANAYEDSHEECVSCLHTACLEGCAAGVVAAYKALFAQAEPQRPFSSAALDVDEGTAVNMLATRFEDGTASLGGSELKRRAQLVMSSKDTQMAAMFAAANGALDVLKLLFGSYVDSEALDIAALVRAAAGNDRVAAMELTLKEPAGEKLRRNPSLLVPALSHAVRRHCVKSAEFLVQMGVCASGNDCGLLLYAVVANDLPMVVLLCERAPGVQPAVRDNLPVRAAASHGAVDVLRYLCSSPLLRRGVDPAADNCYAVRAASLAGHLDAVKFLCELPLVLGINPGADDNYCVRLAAEENHLAVVEYLCQLEGRGVQPGARDNAALRVAAAEGHLAVVQYLCERVGPDRGIDAGAQNSYGVRGAAANGHLDVVKYLCEVASTQYDINPSSHDNSAMSLAAEHGHLHVVKYLYSIGVSPAGDDNFAVGVAAYNGHFNVVRYLMEEVPEAAGVDVTANNNYAVRLAAANGHLRILRYLCGGIPRHRRAAFAAHGEESVRLAASHGHSGTVMYLCSMAHKEDPDRIAAYYHEVLVQATARGNLGMLRWLCDLPLESGVDLSADDSAGLRHAMSSNHLALVRYLCEVVPPSRGLDWTAKTFNGPGLAAKRGHMEVVRYVCERLLSTSTTEVATACCEEMQLSALGAGQLAVVRYLCEVAGAALPEWSLLSVAFSGSVPCARYILLEAPTPHVPTLEEVQRSLSRATPLSQSSGVSFVQFMCDHVDVKFFDATVIPRPAIVWHEDVAVCIASTVVARQCRLGLPLDAAVMALFAGYAGAQRVVAEARAWNRRRGLLLCRELVARGRARHALCTHDQE